METSINKKNYTFTYSENKPDFSIPFTVKFGRMIFKVLSKVSTGLSSNFASYLFFRPRKQPFRAYDREMIKRASTKIIEFNDKKIQTYIWGPQSNKKVLFVHGWEGKGTSVKHFIDPLLSLGYQLFSFDAPAHGASSGSSTDLPEIIATIQHINSLYGEFDVIIAHSFGTLSALNAFNGIFNNKKLVLIASLSNPFTAVKGFQNIFSLNDKVVKGLLNNIVKRVGRPLQDLELKDLSDLGSNNILLLHDKRDVIAPFSESIFLQNNFPNAQFNIISRAGHHKILSEKTTIDTVVNFLSH